MEYLEIEQEEITWNVNWDRFFEYIEELESGEKVHVSKNPVYGVPEDINH